MAQLCIFAAVAGAGNAALADETLIPKLMLGTQDFYLRFYGRIDSGLLIADDGHSTLGYGPVGNGNATSLAGLLAHARISPGLTFGGKVEGQYDPYSTDYVNQTNRGDPDWGRGLLRRAEFYAESEQFGTLWIGQGSMASDGSAEVDLSGTANIGYASVSDLAGGQLFAFSAGNGLSTVSVGDVFDDIDGLGRKLRIRYDTPSFAGFTLSGSYGTQVVPDESGIDVWDVALGYGGALGGFSVAGAAAYSVPGPGRNRYDGSISALHVASGLSLTASAGYDQRSDSADGRFVYGKIGYQRQLITAGVTALSVDIYRGDDIGAAGSESFSWGAQVVQNIDYYQTQIYLGLRSYEYEDTDADYDRIVAALAGLLIEF